MKIWSVGVSGKEFSLLVDQDTCQRQTYLKFECDFGRGRSKDNGISRRRGCLILQVAQQLKFHALGAAGSHILFLCRSWVGLSSWALLNCEPISSELNTYYSLPTSFGRQNKIPRYPCPSFIWSWTSRHKSSSFLPSLDQSLKWDLMISGGLGTNWEPEIIWAMASMLRAWSLCRPMLCFRA